ncbi:hypothetical protein BD626DRAFT_549668 [Schizophyllum amplum]|uniref:F-box domain-containing protein n=1 Tax=Schizophyllum amplum TaxID=97359 RepID=A0A550C6B6_9AGAR|nr:hypothetical protein BD626DRAFT_549668 [Auriculariopsis ampla]
MELSWLGRITRFRLSAVAVDTLDDILALVCAFPHLETLALDDLIWDFTEGSSLHVLPPSLYRLHLGSLYKRDILQWLLTRATVPFVRHLSLGAVAPPDTPAIGAYVAAAAPELHSLRVVFNSLDAGGDAEDFCTAVKLSRCFALRSIWVDELVYFALFRLTSPFPWIAAILLQAAALPVLTRIMLSLHIDAANQLDASEQPAHWARLDAVFVPPNFPALVSVDVLVCGEADLRMVDVSLRMKLPMCAGRGLLRVGTCGPMDAWD